MVEIDVNRFSCRELNSHLRETAEQTDRIVLLNPDARHNLVVGLTTAVSVTIQGSAGYFCAGLCDGPVLNVSGNVGWGFGDNLMNGLLSVDGNAGAVCGVAMRSGDVLVRGNIGSRAGQVMKGGTLLCLGNAGYRAGSMMMGGTIIILGDAREALGEFIMDGEIYVAGKIESLGEDAVITEMRGEDDERLARILEQHEVTYSGGFQKIISDQRALRYAEYESGELLFGAGAEKKAQDAVVDGNRDVMNFDAD